MSPSVVLVLILPRSPGYATFQERQGRTVTCCVKSKYAILGLKQAIIGILAALLLIQLPADAPGKTVDNDPSAWGPDSHVRELDEAAASWVHMLWGENMDRVCHEFFH